MNLTYVQDPYDQVLLQATNPVFGKIRDPLGTQ